MSHRFQNEQRSNGIFNFVCKYFYKHHKFPAGEYLVPIPKSSHFKQEKIKVIFSNKTLSKNVDESFITKIFEIITENAQEGSFIHKVHFKNKEISHKLLFASGLGYLHWKKKYKEFFSKELPLWVEILHPQHINSLCNLAIKLKKPLPRNPKFE